MAVKLGPSLEGRGEGVFETKVLSRILVPKGMMGQMIFIELS
jgi:hypothetical protein